MLMKTPETAIQQNIQKVIDKLESIGDANFDTTDVWRRRRGFEKNDDECFVGCVYGWAKQALGLHEPHVIYEAFGIDMPVNSDQSFLRATLFGAEYCTREDAIQCLRYIKEGNYADAYRARHHRMPSL